MSEYPRAGDRVRVTYEGTVTEASDLMRRHFSVNGHRLPHLASAAIEVLESEPFPVGTVAVLRGYPEAPLVRGEGGWFTREGNGSVSTDDDIRSNNRWAIVYEPPA